MLSSAKARVGAVDEVGLWTPKDACCCAMSCERVSIFVKNFFFNLAKLGTSRLRLSLPYLCAGGSDGEGGIFEISDILSPKDSEFSGYH